MATPKPLLDKLNPLWWFGKEDDQGVGTMTSNVGDEAPWYHPEWPQWRRYMTWNFLRNPFNDNFTFYVIGVQDRDFTVNVIKGNPDPGVHQRDDVGETGWQISMLTLHKSGIKLPWISYSSVGTPVTVPLLNKKITIPGVEFNLGWSPNGNFTAKLHPHKADA